MKLQVSVDIRATPKAVWEAVEDIGGHHRWMLDARAIRFTTSQRTGVGTTFECDTVIRPFRLVDRMEVTEWSPQRAMGVRHTGLVSGEGRFTNPAAAAPTGADTRFTWEERLRFPWWLGGPVGALAAKPVLGAVWRRSLRNLQRLVEEP